MNFLNKKSIRDKYLGPLLQLVIIAMLFIFVFDKECVFIFKNILDKLQICESYQAIIYNLLIPIKMFCHSPSVVAFLFVTLQFVCITTTFKFITQLFEKPFLSADSVVENEGYWTEKYINNKTCVYLENQRLLC